jgi:EAL domain-containing protein (putative c-di-GMP-specific phosphodiesterase class I)
LFQHANIALEYTKQFGRGYSVYNEANDPYTQLKRAYVGGLRNAIEQNQITLYYQPKVDLRTGRTRGVEALVHWNHPVHGTVPAQQFVPVAERTGLIHALSRWVLRSAIAQCDVWRRLGREMPVAVNLSPRNFHDDQLPDYIDRLLERHKLPAKLLEIEITEGVILTDAHHISKALHDLSRKGVRIFIDDFGTGYSSLGHLKRLPIAGVKIDRIFISQLTSHAHDAAIVRSIIDLGHRLSLEVIAEGVETRGIWQKLATLNCDAAQGYLMCPPRPAADLDDWFVHAPWRIGKISTKKNAQHHD